MEIAYRITRSDAWRCKLHVLSGQPTVWIYFLLTPALATWYAYWQFPLLQSSLHLYSAHWWRLPSVFLWIFCTLVFPSLAGIRNKVIKFYPDTESNPINVTVLTSEHLCDAGRKVVGGRIVLLPADIPWIDIKKIWWHRGDVYFRRKNGYNIIPRTAFDDPRQGQVFYDTATAYWRSAKSGLPVTQDGEVWPPPPRLD